MALVSQLPCDGDGICMICKNKPSPEDTLTCKTCATPWHVTCLPSSARPQTIAEALRWDCPDCSLTDHPHPPIAEKTGSSDELVAAVRAIQSDDSLTELEKARRRQELVSGGGARSSSDDGEKAKNKEGINDDNDVLAILDENINCSICMQLPERPVTTPCGHNFCLKCFQKWVAQGKRTCANCRSQIPSAMASQPRINSALVIAIRMAKLEKANVAGGAPKVYHFVHNQNRPDKAYTTERAKKPGKANACSGKIFVTAPPDHFGPILAENDPLRKQGVLVGETWEDRMECRQWGAHLPHVAGIAGQSKYGAQSVALSGGYIDDEDHGEWFLYTGSGGRDLSGNKRTNKTQSFDQKFEKLNEALRLSCQKGYPVRVVRSHKEKRSSYAPEAGVRYDGVYRIEKCWRKNGIQGYKVCRYLFVRCDNDPAPWTSDIHGDRPRPLPAIKELKNAIDITERKGSASWDYDEVKSCWMWKNPPPCSRKQVDDGNIVEGKKRRRAVKNLSAREKLLKEFSCQICRDVMTSPLTTPCAHNFCKACLEGAFAGQSFTRERTCEGRRTLRDQKNVMKCPSCLNDIAEFLQNPQVNRELMSVIESLHQRSVGEEQSGEASKEVGSRHEGDAAADDTEMFCGNSEILENNNLKSRMEGKAQQTDKFKRARKGKSTFQERSMLEQLDVEKGGNEGGSVKPRVAESRALQTNEAERKIKQTNKRKKSSTAGSPPIATVGVMTRSKRAKLIAK
ncbi:SRA-YDG - like 2 [Theobroma cacao]|uniref:RING-type E3 ubiquitin transferase n=1 Tax=Theobroma cacao TaxID=3641 RepID=A0A061E3K2_THECC|nr:Zinc finger family protein isoform 1 [Theobroma cacao]WRX14660.1 SRA-YDG - like 2 [Theobroma cacao]